MSSAFLAEIVALDKITTGGAILPRLYGDQGVAATRSTSKAQPGFKFV